MPNFQNLEFKTLPPLSGENPENIVIMLHGLGADGNDLLSMAPYYAESLPNTLFVAPNAPEACDMAPPGTPNMGYQWFSLQDRSPDVILKGVEGSAPILNNFIEQQLAVNDLTPDKLVLLGFSQGTMMSFYVGPRMKQACAGIVGFSGALVGGGEALKAPEIVKPPILAIHGDQDDVVPFDCLDTVYQDFLAAGFSIEALTCPGTAHGIDPLGMMRSINFIQEVFEK